MGIADKSVSQLTEVTQEHLGSTLRVQVALSVFGRHPMISSGMFAWAFGRPRILVATDDDLRLLDVGGGRSLTTIVPGATIATYPRATRLGPPKGVHHKVVLPDGEKIYLHRVLFDYVRQIDGDPVAN